MEIEQQNNEFKLNSIDDKWNELSNPTKLNRQTWEPTILYFLRNKGVKQ